MSTATDVTLAQAAARCWRKHGMPARTDVATFEAEIAGLVNAEFARRRVDNPAGAEQDQMATPTYALDAFPGPKGPAPDAEFGRQVEELVATMVNGASTWHVVGEIKYYAARRAYMYDHFLWADVCRAPA